MGDSGKWKGGVSDFRSRPNLNRPAGRIPSPSKHSGMMSAGDALASANMRISGVSPDSESESAQTRKASQPRLGKRASPDSASKSAQTRSAQTRKASQPRLGMRVSPDSESESAQTRKASQPRLGKRVTDCLCIPSFRFSFFFFYYLYLLNIEYRGGSNVIWDVPLRLNAQRLAPPAVSPEWAPIAYRDGKLTCVRRQPVLQPNPLQAHNPDAKAKAPKAPRAPSRPVHERSK